MIRVTCWNEYYQEHRNPDAASAYPAGIHAALQEGLVNDKTLSVRTATLNDTDCGLPQAILEETDVLLWWGHVKHDAVPDSVADRVVKRVQEGMGFIALHSGHMSKPFMRLMGTTCDLRWRESNDRERLWAVRPGHPILDGLPPYFELPAEETYGEYFDIPQPDEVILIGWFSGGEVFRSGCCFTRSAGRIFYFQPGHETYPTYYQKDVRQIIRNAVHWAAPAYPPQLAIGHRESLEINT
jgi:trehalose utilization protein